MAAMISEAKMRRVRYSVDLGLYPAADHREDKHWQVRAVGAGNEIRDLQIQCLDAMNNTNFF